MQHRCRHSNARMESIFPIATHIIETSVKQLVQKYEFLFKILYILGEESHFVLSIATADQKVARHNRSICCVALDAQQERVSSGL
jgi:hypothetical protein